MLDSDTSAQAAAVAQHQSDQPVLEQPVRVGAGYSDSIFNMLQQLENLSISNNDSSIASSCLGPHDGEDMDMSRSEEHAESYAEKNGGTDSTACHCSSGLLSRHAGEHHIVESSFMCDKCGCIISRARMEQHYLYWCESQSRD